MFPGRCSNDRWLCRYRPALLAASVILAVAGTAHGPVRAAHPISVTEARIFVTRSSARVRIQLFAEDLLLFHQLQPKADGTLPPEELKRGLELHKQFLVERVTLRDADGNRIPSRVTDVEPFDIPEQGIPEEDLMLYQATYELEFPFTEPPEFLTFQQDITDDNYILPSEMQVVIQQTGTGNVIAGTLLPGGAVTHRFDWDDLLDPQASDEEYESWLEKQREETLGITSYSSVYSFIYIDPGEVRHEILIPLATLNTILPIRHADPAFLSVAEQPAVRRQIEIWLSELEPAEINGQDVRPEFSRIDFYGLKLRDFARRAEPQRVSFASGRVGIILRYVAPEGPVRQAALSWNLFRSSLRKIRSVVMPWSGAARRFEFSRFKAPADNVLSWEADPETVIARAAAVPRRLPDRPRLQIPLVSILLFLCSLVLLLTRRRMFIAGAAVCLAAAGLSWPLVRIDVPHPLRPVPRLTEERAGRIVQQLHRGTYDALQFGSERQIYAALDRFVAGDLLENLYLQLRDSLAVREQGGAVARVRAVDYLEGQTVHLPDRNIPWPGFFYRLTWQVTGTVEHWGHVHERRNQFSAVLGIQPVEGRWKITSLDIEAQKTLAGSTKLRDLDGELN